MSTTTVSVRGDNIALIVTKDAGVYAVVVDSFTIERHTLLSGALEFSLNHDTDDPLIALLSHRISIGGNEYVLVPATVEHNQPHRSAHGHGPVVEVVNAVQNP